jgi:hypothetical protein
MASGDASPLSASSASAPVSSTTSPSPSATSLSLPSDSSPLAASAASVTPTQPTAITPGSIDALAGGTFAHLTTGISPSSPADPRPTTPGATTTRRPLSDLDRIAAALDPRPTTPSNRTPSIPRQPSRRSFTHSPLSIDRDLTPPHYREPHPATIRNESGYFGYANHARRTHELNRRDEHIDYLTDIAEQTRAKILSLGQDADQAFRDGLTLRGEDHRRRATELSAIVEDIENQIDRVRTGELAPATIEVTPNDWARINDDVGDLAPGGVRTDDLSALTGTGDPRSIDQTRHYNTSGGLRAPLAVHQTDLEDAVPRDGNGRPQRLPDPRKGSWFRLANDGGPEADPTRALNCVDGVLSLFDTYIHGRPRVSAPRTFDTYAHGNPDRPLGGEVHGVRRIQEATGSTFQNLCPYVGEVAPATAKPAMDLALRNLTNHLHNAGHGAYAFIITDMESGGSHAWAATNHNGAILFLDPQIGKISENFPLYHHRGVPSLSNITSLNALVVDGHGVPAPLPHHGPGHRAASPAGLTGETPSEPSETPTQRDERLAFNSLPSSQRELLQQSVEEAEVVATAVSRDLHRVVDGLSDLGLDDRTQIIDEDERVKSSGSLARKLRSRFLARREPAARIIERVNDRVRFSVQVSEQHYGETVRHILHQLQATGYREVTADSFWSGNGRHNGLNVTLRSPDGFVLEIQFPTPLSADVGHDTHMYYEDVRRDNLPIDQRVSAFLRILRINRDRGIYAHIPQGLDVLGDFMTRSEPIDTSLAAWLAKGNRLPAYREYLTTAGKSFDEVLEGHGLRVEDVPGIRELGLIR